MGSRTIVLMIDRSFMPLSFPTVIKRTGNPSFGSTLASMPRAVPTNRTSLPLSLEQLAGDGDPRIQMTSGPSACDHDLHTNNSAKSFSPQRTQRQREKKTDKIY